jgi:hypothetical protein
MPETIKKWILSNHRQRIHHALHRTHKFGDAPGYTSNTLRNKNVPKEFAALQYARVFSF